jgi:hypothetical protein
LGERIRRSAFAYFAVNFWAARGRVVAGRAEAGAVVNPFDGLRAGAPGYIHHKDTMAQKDFTPREIFSVPSCKRIGSPFQPSSDQRFSSHPRHPRNPR